MDRGAWQATVHRVAELDTIEVTKHEHEQINSCTYGQLIYNKGAKNMRVGKNSLLKKINGG